VSAVRFVALVLMGIVASAASVYAASLGNIEVKSKLYEPFEARIALRGVSEADLDALNVTLADQAVFDQAGLSRPFALSALKFEVVATGARRGYVRITTHERVREPALSFIVIAQFAAGTLQRRYDVLLDLK
jgi:pilus assembly protein FimV